ncbi:MAG: peptidoglycan DD-metalloendopeptidase family protein, partial [Hyphomicrobium sp.]
MANPTASGVTVTKAAGASTPLSALFAYFDADNDIVSFAIKDREIGGGYLTFNGNMQPENVLIDFIPIAQIGQWAFVAGPAGSTSTIGFNANDSMGGFNPSAVSTVNVAAVAAPHDPTATGVTVSKAAGQSTPLSSLFAYSDLDNDIVEFAVKDREVGGGYLTFNSTPQTANILIDHIPISQIGQWAFVAGPAGSTSTIGFNAIDSRGAFNPSAVSTVNVGSLTSNAILLAHYPVFGVEQIAQGNRDTDDSHITSSALQWGYDFLAASKPVLSVAGGTVVAVKSDLAGSFVGYGNVVTVLHDGGFYATYAHLAFNSVNVTVDQRVEAGSELATSGSTGTPAAHLHIQFGTAATLINTKNGDAATATLIANGSLDSVAPAYFSKLLVRYVEGDPKDTSYYGTQGIDDFTGNSLANVVDGLDDNDILRGEAGGDTLRGGKGNDLLNGGTGADNLYGGIGDDIMIVDNASDKAFEALGQGTNDNVYATSSFTLAAGQEIEGLSANPQASTNPINLTG